MRPNLIVFCCLIFSLFFSSCNQIESPTGMATHEIYNLYSSVQERASVYNSLRLNVNDTVIYKQAYYSVNGSAWEPIHLSGEKYGNKDDWLDGSGSLIFPGFFNMPGTHYLIFYSCSRTGKSWNCHDKKWQLYTINTPERIYSEYAELLPAVNCINDNDCEQEEYCANNICLFKVSGNTYFVAIWGNDSNPGTFEEPFYHWQKGVQTAQPGDMVYIRGGVWKPTELTTSFRNFGMSIDPYSHRNTSGTTGNATHPIRYFNYPGERPIMDGIYTRPNIYQWNSGIAIANAQYIHLKGLTVRNIFQTPPNFSHVKPHSEVYGLGCSPCANILYENMVVHDIDGRGFSHWGSAWSHIDAQDSYDRCIQREKDKANGNPDSCKYSEPPFAYDNTTWINCDAYNLFDRYASTPGNAADGWKVGTYGGNVYTWMGCRAFNYSDDGFDPHGSGKRVFINNWAMPSDKYNGLSDDWGIEANGFKTTAYYLERPPMEYKGVVFKDNIAAFGSGSGIIVNLGVNFNTSFPTNAILYNNFAYKMRGGFWDFGGGWGDKNIRTSIYKNNIAYGGWYAGQGRDNLYEVGIYYPSIYDESHNTWRATPHQSWPGWEPNPDFNVTDDDFVSLDFWELAPRKPDFSLPDISFGRLELGSDLIDGGIVVPGFHCPSAGEHSNDDCRVWFGEAPDLGPFESR
jgi:hypothetical protein